MYKINLEDFYKFLGSLAQKHRVFIPDRQGCLIQYGRNMEIDWHIVPVWGGIKEFVFPARNLVAGADEDHGGITVLFGIRNCDLRALCGILDRVFLEEKPVDTVYERLRKNLRIVTVDCHAPADTCFCMAVGGLPYCERNYDLNLSFIDGYVLLDTGTREGEILIGGINYTEAAAEDLKKKENLRDTGVRKVRKNSSLHFTENDFPEKILHDEGSDYWREKSSSCIQCGGCNFCCPSCYCSVLNEVSSSKNIKKARQWDSCQFQGYSRMAGRVNPGKELWQRFQDKYLCKFNLMNKEFKVSGCTGCGRCIQVCPGRIDMRDIIFSIKKMYE